MLSPRSSPRASWSRAGRSACSTSPSRHTTTETTTLRRRPRRSRSTTPATSGSSARPPAAPCASSPRVTEGLRSPGPRGGARAPTGRCGSRRRARCCFTGQCDVRYDVSVPRDVAVRAERQRRRRRRRGPDQRPADRAAQLRRRRDGDRRDGAPTLRLSSSAGDVEARGVSARAGARPHSSAGDVARRAARRRRTGSTPTAAPATSRSLVPDAVYRLDADSRARATSTPADVRIDPRRAALDPRALERRRRAGRRPPLALRRDRDHPLDRHPRALGDRLRAP